MEKRKSVVKTSTPSILSETIGGIGGMIGDQLTVKNPMYCEICGVSLGLLDKGSICHDCRKEIDIADYRRRNITKVLADTGVGKRYLSCALELFTGGAKYIDWCQKWLANPADGIFFSGQYGCGKTHLAVAICRELLLSARLPSVLFVYSVDLLYSIRESFSSDGAGSIINKHTSVDYLILDDLGAEKSTEWAIETLSLIIDRRDRNMLPTIVTSNLSLADIEEKLSGRIASRLANGKVVKIDMPDYRKQRKGK